MNIDGLWATYHHIAKLQETGEDERGNTWAQETYGKPIISPESWRWVTIRLADIRFAKEAADVVRQPGEICKTAMCFAGWYAMLHGTVMNRLGEVVMDGHLVSVDSFTQCHAGLGLNDLRLFSPCNDLDAIKSALIDITGKDWS